MTSVCFTGRGANRNGAFCERGILEHEARSAGWDVHTRVCYDTTWLVSSRTDTVKARDAARYGATVITYEAFWRLMDTAFQQRSGGMGGGVWPEPVGPTGRASSAHPNMQQVARETVTSHTLSDDLDVANRMPRAQTHPCAREMQEHNREVFRVLCRAPGSSSTLRPIETDRKAQTFEDVEAETTWEDIYALLDNHRPDFVSYLPIITTQQAGLTRSCSPFDDFGSVLQAADMICFVLRRHDADYFVNTEGFSYCRYLARIKPFNGPTNSSIATARIPGQRYVVLDEEA